MTSPSPPDSDPSLSVDSTQPKPWGMRITRLLLALLIWTYALVLLAGWFLIRREGERWWFATLILFGPRWVFAVPMMLLVPLVFLLRWRMLWIVTAEAALLIFGILNVAVPWRTWSMPAENLPHLRLLTCNVHRQFLDAPALARLIDQTNPDVVVLQEWAIDQRAEIFHSPGWYIRDQDWSQMLIASRFPIQRSTEVIPHTGLDGVAFSYDLAMPQGTIRLINVHLASPHLVFSAALHRQPGAPDEIAENCQRRLDQSQTIARYCESSTLPTLLAGDFNTPPDSETFRNSWTNFHDAFTVAGWGTGVTYRLPWTRARIDHVLYSRNWQCRHCWIGPDVGSPHLPVLADLEWVR